MPAEARHAASESTQDGCSPELTQGSRHCEEQSDEAIQVLFLDCFALRFAVGSQ